MNVSWPSTASTFVWHDGRRSDDEAAAPDVVFRGDRQFRPKSRQNLMSIVMNAANIEIMMAGRTAWRGLTPGRTVLVIGGDRTDNACGRLSLRKAAVR